MDKASFDTFMNERENNRRESENIAPSPLPVSEQRSGIDKAAFSSFMTQKAKADTWNDTSEKISAWGRDADAFGQKVAAETQDWKATGNAAIIGQKISEEQKKLAKRGAEISDFFKNYGDEYDASEGAGASQKVIDAIGEAQAKLRQASDYYGYIAKGWSRADNADDYRRYTQWDATPERSSADVMREIEELSPRVEGFYDYALKDSPTLSDADYERLAKQKDELSTQLDELRKEYAYRNQNEKALALATKQAEWKKNRRGTDVISLNLDTVTGNIKDLEREEGRLAGVLNDLESGRDLPGFDAANYEAVKRQHDDIERKLKDLEPVQKELSEELEYSKKLDWEELRNNPDFAEKSRHVSTGATLFKSAGGGELDAIYGAVNRESAAWAQYAASRLPGELLKRQAPSGGIELSQITESERETFNYLYATDKEKAREYFDELRPKLTARQRRGMEDYLHDWTQESGWNAALGSVATVLTSPLKAASYFGQAADYLTTGKIDQNALYNAPSYWNNAVRGAVAENWGEFGTAAYQTAMSMGDFLWNAFITGGLSVGGAVAENLSLAIMGAGAAADTVIAQKDRGMDDTRAFTLGTVAGLAEIVTEKVSLEALLHPELSRGTMRYILKNMLAEGSEEVASDLLNYWADGLYDVISGQSESEWKKAVQRYRDMGYTEAEAFGKAVGDKASEMGMDFLGGAVSGGLMAGGSAAINAYQSSDLYKNRTEGKALSSMNLAKEDYKAIVDEGLAAPEGSEAREAAEQIKVKLDTGKKVSQAEYGKLWRLTNAAIDVALGITPAQNEQKNSASDAEATLPKMKFEDFANSKSTVWRNVPYDDLQAQQNITDSTHQQMVNEGRVVGISDESASTAAKGYPDLRSLKKSERTPILKQSINKLKSTIRDFLNGLKKGTFEFEVNGNILEARLYDTGVKEVMEKITQDKASMLLQSDEIFRNAQYLYSTPDYSGDPNVYRWNYFYTPVEIGEDLVGVRIAVRDVANPAESQIYHWGIKKDTTLGGGGRGQSRISSDASSVVSTQNIPQTRADSQEGNVTSDSLTGSAFLDDVLRNILEKGGKVTNNQARQIAGDRTMLDALAEITGLDLSHIGEQSDGKQRRQAKSAVYQAVGEIRRNSGTAFGTDALSKLGIKVEGNVARYGQTAQLLADVESRRSLERQRRKAEQRLNASDKEKEFAARIAAGIFTEADIPDTVNRSTVLELADHYWAQLNANNEHLGRVKAEIRDMLDGKMEELFKNADNAKEPSAIGLNYGTPERNMLRIFGDDDGMKIYDYIFAPVAENEAERKKFSNRMHDEVRKIEGKNGKAAELNNAESALVQMVIEGKAASEAVAGMETKRMIENAAHNLMNGQEKGDVAKMFGLTWNEVDLADRYARWLRAQEMLESGEYDSVKIENAAKKYSEMYDKLYAAINDFLVAHGYDPIGFIKGYAPHMQPEENISMLNKVAESLGIGAAVNKLPTSIAGRTADFKPNKRWDPHFLQRLGNETEYNVVKGFQQYIDYVSDIFYHTDDVMRVRAASRWLRKTYSPENIRANIEWAEGLRSAPTETKASLLRDEGVIGKDTVLSAADTSRLMDQYIEQLFSQIDKTSKFGDLVTWMDNYANILAGKQSMADRSAESTFGRKTLNTGNKLVNGFAKAQVAGNISSMLNQIAQIPQIFAELKGKYTRRALLDMTLKELFTGELKKSGWAEDSVYLTNKKGIDFLVTDKSEKIITAMFKPAEFMDGFVSTLAVRGKYLQEIGNGATHAEAMKAADTFGRQIMGDRTKGVKPTAFQSKNPVMQMLNIFQIEALNSWNHIFEDLPREIRQMSKTEGKDKAAKYLASIIIKSLLAAFAVNRVAEEEYGGTPAPFDILGLTTNFIASGEGLSTNTYIRTIIDNGWEKLTGERLFGTDPEKMNEEFDWGSAIKETAANVSNDIPFLRNVSGMAGWGDKSLPMPNVVETGGDLLSSLFDEGGPFTPETAKNAVNFLAEVLPGGKQAKKTAFGIEALIRGGDYSGYGEKEKLKYTVGGDALEDIKAILFGKYSTTSSNDYYASGAKSLSEKQTKVWKELKASGADPDYLYDSIQKYRKIAADEDLSTYERGRREREFVKNMKLSDKQKLDFYRGVTSADNRADKFEKMMNSGLNFNEVLAVYETYAEINEKDIKASEKATEFYRALDFMRFSDRQEATIKDCLKYYSQVPAEANRYEKFRATGMDAETAYQYTQALADIKIESGRTTATTAQKWRAVLDPSASTEEQMKALSVVMDEKQYAKLELAREFDIPPEAFVILKETLPDNSPTQAELEEYIEKMANYKTRSGGRVKLTNQQMAALWQIYGGYDSARNNPFDITTGEKVITKNGK